MRIHLNICECGELQRDHVGNRGRCQARGGCKQDCQRYVKAKGANKYSAVRVGGADSKLEADRFAELRTLERGGAIRDLKIHHTLDVAPPNDLGIHIRFKIDALYQERQKDGRWITVAEDSKAIGLTDGGRFPTIWKLVRLHLPTAILRVSHRRKGWGRQPILTHDDLPKQRD